MQTIINDIEEYDGRHCTDQDNGFDNSDWDDFEYADLANHVGLETVEVYRGPQA